MAAVAGALSDSEAAARRLEHDRKLARSRAEAVVALHGTRSRAIDGIPELLAESEGLEAELGVIAAALLRVLGCQGLAIYALLEPTDLAAGPIPVARAGDFDWRTWPGAALLRPALTAWVDQSVAPVSPVSTAGATILPITYHRECVGALAIRHGEAGLPQDARLRDVGNLLGLAALTIANQRLRADGRRRLAEIRALREVGRAVGFGLSTESVLEGIFAAGARILSYDTASLFVVDEAAGMLRLAASRNIPAEVARRSQFRIGTGVVGWVIEQERPAIVADTRQDARYRLTGLGRRRAHSLLVVPLRMRGRVIAALSFSRHRPNAFSPDDLDLAEVIAAYAAQALEHSRLARAAEEAESLRHGAELLASISHDIRTPLQMIRVVVEMLQQESAELAPPQAELLNTIAGAAERLGKLINVALETSRLEANLVKLDPEPVRLAELAESVLAGLAWRAGAGHRLTLAVPPDLEARVDPTQFHRVLSNLVDNAIKYSPAGGEVTIRGWRDERGVAVSVADQGIGVDPERVGRLFDRYYRASEQVAASESFGLGLYICKRIVEAHSGTIEVESRPGEGTTFTVRLPAPA